MRGKVKIGAVGLGGHGRAMLDAIKRCANLEVVACFDVDGERTRTTAAEFACKACGSFAELLGVRGLRAVTLVVPNHVHSDYVISAAEAGRACFVEKPIANTLAEARRMIAACEENDVVLAVAHNFRRLAQFRKAKELIDSGELGCICGFEGNLSRPGASLLVPDDWRRSVRTCPMPSMMQLGIHIVDGLMYIFGQVRSVSAMTWSMPSFDAVSVSAMIEFRSRLCGSVNSNYLSKERWHVNIYGERANLYFGGEGFLIDRAGGGPEKVDLEPVDTLVEELHEFGEGVSGRGEVEVDGNGGLAALKVVRAMVTSAAKGLRVSV
jgi:predicted dehydrogenase